MDYIERETQLLHTALAQGDITQTEFYSEVHRLNQQCGYDDSMGIE